MSNPSIAELHREAVQALNRGAFEAAHGRCIEILERDPGFADAWFLLGMIALAHGRVGKALELVDRALAQSPNHAEYLAHKSRCLVLLKQDSSALETARHALSLQPSDALTLDTIGVVLSKAGDHVAAIEAFEQAVASQRDRPQFYFNLGSSQQFLGRFDAAARSYEQAIALKPDFFRAHWALSELSGAEPGSGRVERLRSLLDRHGNDDEAELYLCHALAKELERRGEYAQAFAYWERGKQGQLSRAHFGFDDYRAMFDALRTVCSAEFVSKPGGYPSPEPVFVVGMPRTGTTLVEQMLGSLDEVFAAGELDDFGLVLKRASGTRTNRILDVETIEAVRNADYAAIGRTYVEQTRPRTGHTARFVDKLPTNFLYAGFIHRALPEARIVCLMRNPLDTCLSNFRQLFSTRTPYYSYASDLLDTGRYYIEFRELIAHWQSVLPPDRFLVTHYEKLVESPEREARRIVDFCGLPWSDRVLEFHASTQPAATASAVQVRQPIYRDAVQRWRRYERELEPLKALFAGHDIDVT
jgi:tetratricopeptide (TPR) repeat protein